MKEEGENHGKQGGNQQREGGIREDRAGKSLKSGVEISEDRGGGLAKAIGIIGRQE